MQFKKTFVILLFVSFLFSCGDSQTERIMPQIIPIPLSQTIIEGHFIVNNSTGIQYDSDFKIAANFLKTFIEKGSSILINDTESTQNIVFIKDETIQNVEGYSLKIIPSKIEIKSSTPQGAFYAVQSLRQLLPSSFENGTFQKKKLLFNV